MLNVVRQSVVVPKCFCLRVSDEEEKFDNVVTSGQCYKTFTAVNNEFS
jgi:hypothetical protein